MKLTPKIPVTIQVMALRKQRISTTFQFRQKPSAPRVALKKGPQSSPLTMKPNTVHQPAETTKSAGQGTLRLHFSTSQAMLSAVATPAHTMAKT
jgi:hypothetical protein